MRISDWSSDVCSSDLLDIDNAAVLETQVERLRRIRASRDEDACRKALDALTKAAAENTGNLLALSVEAARARATVGDMSDALEKVFSRHRAVIRSISGVYGSAYEGDQGFARTQAPITRQSAVWGKR